MGLAAASVGVFLAMHHNLFGPSGENMYWLRNVWEALCRLVRHPGDVYPPEDLWTDINLFRPSLIAFGASYLFLLLVLRFGWIGRRVQLRTMLIVAAAVAIPLLLMPYLWSSDIFDYIVYGRLAFVYHTNPYRTAICEFPTDAFYNMTCWKSATSVYGPAWTLLSIVLVAFCELLRAGPGLYVLVFKTLSLACHLASSALIWKMLTRARNMNRAFGTALYLFNPLALTEFAGNGHNEAFLILMLLLAIWLAQKGRWGLATVAFALAVQTKFYVLPMMCLYLASRWWSRDNRRQAWISAVSIGLIFIAVMVLLDLPFGFRDAFWAPFMGVAANSMTKSLGEFIVYKSSLKLENLPLFGILFSGGGEGDVKRVALLSTFLLCVASAVYARSLSRAVTAMALFGFFWCAVGATWFMPWYFTVPVALVPLAGSKKIGFSTVMGSLLVFLIYLLEGWSFSSNGDAHNHMVGVYELWVFCPPLAMLAAWSAFDGLRAVWRIGTIRPGRERPHMPSARAEAS